MLPLWLLWLGFASATWGVLIGAMLLHRRWGSAVGLYMILWGAVGMALTSFGLLYGGPT